METDIFTLDAVAAELIGEGKAKVDIEKLAPAWDEDDAKLQPISRPITSMMPG